MELTEPIKKVISTVLKKHNQPYEEEFSEFIKHIMNSTFEEQEVIDRIESIELGDESDES